MNVSACLKRLFVVATCSIAFAECFTYSSSSVDIHSASATMGWHFPKSIHHSGRSSSGDLGRQRWRGRCMAVSPDGPDPSTLISAKDDTTQRLAFFAAFAALAVGTNLCVQLWHGPGEALLGAETFERIRGTVFPISFGLIFAIVGVLHFVFVENFARIVPPRGTWGGLWQVPAPFQKEFGIPSYEYYHSYWSGVAECVGGLWLLVGGLGYTTVTEPALLLFLLTVGVTPANLYMFTHNAEPGGAVPRLAYPVGHIARFILQCGLLSNFWIMANP